MSAMRHLLLLAFLVCTLRSEPFGTYTNGAEGFYRESLVLAKEGKGLYSFNVGVPVRWRYDAASKRIIIRGNLGTNLKVQERTFEYVPDKDHIITARKASPGDEVLACVGKKIDERIQKFLDSFDWNLEKHEIK